MQFLPGAVGFCIISCYSLYPELPAELSNTRKKLEVCLVEVLEAIFILATGSFSPALVCHGQTRPSQSQHSIDIKLLLHDLRHTMKGVNTIYSLFQLEDSCHWTFEVLILHLLKVCYQDQDHLHFLCQHQYFFGLEYVFGDCCFQCFSLVKFLGREIDDVEQCESFDRKSTGPLVLALAFGTLALFISDRFSAS